MYGKKTYSHKAKELDFDIMSLKLWKCTNYFLAWIAGLHQVLGTQIFGLLVSSYASQKILKMWLTPNHNHHNTEIKSYLSC